MEFQRSSSKFEKVHKSWKTVHEFDKKLAHLRKRKKEKEMRKET